MTRNMTRKLTIVIFSVLLLLSLWPQRGLSQAFIDPRVSALEGQVAQLRAEVSQLRNEIRYLNQSNRPAVSTIPATPPVSSSPVRPETTNSAMFDRLANLAIDLKLRLNEVEARLFKVEKSIAR
jgi:hypothetical protein